jgi:hypothetical protein
MPIWPTSVPKQQRREPLETRRSIEKQKARGGPASEENPRCLSPATRPPRPGRGDMGCYEPINTVRPLCLGPRTPGALRTSFWLSVLCLRRLRHRSLLRCLGFLASAVPAVIKTVASTITISPPSLIAREPILRNDIGPALRYSRSVAARAGQGVPLTVRAPRCLGATLDPERGQECVIGHRRRGVPETVRLLEESS